MFQFTIQFTMSILNSMSILNLEFNLLFNLLCPYSNNNLALSYDARCKRLQRLFYDIIVSIIYGKNVII